MTTIGINDFVRRQIKGSGKTYTSLKFSDLANQEIDNINE